MLFPIFRFEKRKKLFNLTAFTRANVANNTMEKYLIPYKSVLLYYKTTECDFHFYKNNGRWLYCII